MCLPPCLLHNWLNPLYSISYRASWMVDVFLQKLHYTFYSKGEYLHRVARQLSISAFLLLSFNKVLTLTWYSTFQVLLVRSLRVLLLKLGTMIIILIVIIFISSSRGRSCSTTNHHHHCYLYYYHHHYHHHYHGHPHPKWNKLIGFLPLFVWNIGL